VYELKKLFSGLDKYTVFTDEEETLYIEGELEQWLVATVPPSTSESMAKTIENKLMEATDRPVLVLTDNIDLLVSKRISPRKAAEIMKEIREYASKEADSEEEYSDGDHGDRSGMGKDGCGGTNESSGEISEGGNDSSNRNEGWGTVSNSEGEGDDLWGHSKQAEESEEGQKET